MNIKNIKKRAAAEKRFKFYGKFSIFTAITLLIVLFTSIISQGSSAFLETKILLQVHFDSNILDPKNTSNIEEIKKGNFNLIVKRSILEYFPRNILPPFDTNLSKSDSFLMLSCPQVKPMNSNVGNILVIL